jgi:hypothetical protein
MVLHTVCAKTSLKEAQEEVSVTVRACDMKMFSVAYVSGFIAICCDICKRCLIYEVPSPLDIYTAFKDHSSTAQSLTYPTEKLVETVGSAVTVLENVLSMVAHFDSVELYVTDAVKKGVDFGLGQLVVLFTTKELRMKL